MFQYSLAQGTWELKKNENGIAVYTRKVKDEKFKEIRVVCELPGTTTQLINILQNIDDYKNWVYLTKEAYIIKKTNRSTIYYTKTDAPWPVEDRDLILELITEEAPGTKNLVIKAKSLPNYIPSKRDLVRVPYSMALWNVEPLPNNRLKIDYTFSVNPGGDIPAWLVNMSSTIGPYSSFMNLRELMSGKKL